jgi:hypothetical protein
MWTAPSRKAFNQAITEAIDQKVGDPEIDLNTWTRDQKNWVRVKTEELIKSGGGTDNSALSYLTRRPMKGKEGFRKEKIFDDVMTAAEFGLKPISNNPIELAKLKFSEMSRSILANRFLREFESKNDVINASNSGRPMKKEMQQNFDPSEWAPINDKYGTIWHLNPETKLMEKIGYRIAKKPVADIINNYLSSSIYNSPFFGEAYKAYMTVAHTLNQTQLGVLSAFHAGFTSVDVTLSSVTLAVKDLYGVMKGNRTLEDLTKSVIRIPGSFIANPMKGAKVLKEYETPTMDVPADMPVGQWFQTPTQKIALMAKATELAGGGYRMERGLVTTWTKDLVNKWYGGQKIRAAMKAPVAFTELCAKPILEWLVPRQKAGVFAELVTRLVEMNPGKSLNDLTPELRQAWNRVDARLGQVQYNRLFIDNMAKNAIQALVRAPGWTGGTIAEVGGSFKDAGFFLKDWIKTSKMPENIPDRVAYTIALMGGMAVLNGAMTYAFTGEEPKGVDFWAFRDGSIDAHGRPSRWLFPSYQKDIYHYSEDPGKVLLAKMHPMIGLIGDVMRNKDFFGVKITGPEDSMLTKGVNIAEYGIKQFVPFWIRGAQKEATKGGGWMETLSKTPQKIFAPQIGIMPATSTFTSTEFEKFAYGLKDQTSKTKEDYDRVQVRNQLELEVRRGDPGVRDKIQKAVDNHLIHKSDIHKIMIGSKKDKTLNMVIGISFKDLVYGLQNHANAEEKRKLFPILIKKFRSSMPDLTPEERVHYKKVIFEIRNTL